ncbi:MAG: GNAT family N-acetyltransferase [Acidobacteria bacterium]|nr:GNAT family N-acetyltransferase [Acidobacteriota bacterium]
MIRVADLRTVSSRILEPLFAEEQVHWLEQLHWDYRPSIQLISKFIDAKSLAGCAAFEGDDAAGYGFYVLEEDKALVGGLFVAPKYAATDAAERILSQLLVAVRQLPGVERVEAQLMPFGAPLDRAFAAASFALYQRNFMILPLAEARAEPEPLGEGLRIEPWDDRWFEPCAALIQRAYAGHIDAEINDQYRSEAGALRFLKNIVILPGCGQFQPQASFVVHRASPDAATSELVAVVLTSCVSHGVGHTTQICVLPEYRKKALGRRLMAASIQALRSARYHALSLTVTAQNHRAVRLYHEIGFHTVKSFSAAVWQR